MEDIDKKFILFFVTATVIFGMANYFFSFQILNKINTLSTVALTGSVNSLTDSNMIEYTSAEFSAAPPVSCGPKRANGMCANVAKCLAEQKCNPSTCLCEATPMETGPIDILIPFDKGRCDKNNRCISDPNGTGKPCVILNNGTSSCPSSVIKNGFCDNKNKKCLEKGGTGIPCVIIENKDGAQQDSCNQPIPQPSPILYQGYCNGTKCIEPKQPIPKDFVADCVKLKNGVSNCPIENPPKKLLFGNCDPVLKRCLEGSTGIPCAVNPGASGIFDSCIQPPSLSK